jgi:serine/threonine-protein kinase
MNQGSTSQRLRPFKPARFGRYTLLTPLSAGGMGEVFLAKLSGAHGFDKLCVIKKILPHLAADQAFVARFVDEGRILVKLSHGSIAQVLDMGVHEGAPYMAIEFIDGKDLRRVLARMRDRQLPLPLSFVLYVMTRVLDALAYAHRKRGDDDRELNLVHRDMSPQNVLISYEGEVKVIDFGLAKSALSESKTNPSIVLGKFMYMAPEQARHQPVDRRTDLYAVGLCLWELVAGKNPFEGVPQGELMGRVGSPSIPPLNEVEPLCPRALSEAVAKALAVDPAQRFQTAEEFRGRLQAILQEIDPLAGPETATRFMREAFGVEYHAERRMLAAVKEQARELDAAEPDPPAEETLPPNSGPRPTPLAMPALTLGDEPTASSSRLAALDPVALSFQPTPRASAPGARRDVSGEDYEKETMPAIQLKAPAPARAAPALAGPATVPLSVAPAAAPIRAAPLPPPSPPAPAPAAAPIRAKLLAKSFDQEATESAAPAIAEPEPLPSIVVDGLPSEAAKTELEVPAQVSSPRVSRSAQPKLEEEPTAPRGKPASKKPKRPKLEKTGERLAPKVPPPPPKVQRTDTLVLKAVTSEPPPAAKPRAKANWVWLVLPLLAVLALGAFIAFDLASGRPPPEPVEPEAPVEEVPGAPDPAPEVTPTPAPPPAPKAEAVALPPEPEPKPAPAPKAAPEPKKKAPAPKAAAAASSPGQAAFRALEADYERLADDAVQRKFRLQLTALSGQVEAKGDDPAFLAKVEALHAQVRAALAQQ